VAHYERDSSENLKINSRSVASKERACPATKRKVFKKKKKLPNEPFMYLNSEGIPTKTQKTYHYELLGFQGQVLRTCRNH
jgi:hypothetical protein